MRLYDFIVKISFQGTILGTIDIFSENIILNLFQKKNIVVIS